MYYETLHLGNIKIWFNQALETLAFQILHGDKSTFINSFDKTRFSCFTLAPTKLHNFFRN